jgi:iron complex outermembrane receptor protein
VHKWTAGFDIDLIESVNVYLLASYVGTRRFISDLRNTFPMMGNYTTVDVRLQYRKAPFSLYAGINNIFDEEYFEYGTASATSTNKNYYPAPGRNFLVGGSLQF